MKNNENKNIKKRFLLFSLILGGIVGVILKSIEIFINYGFMIQSINKMLKITLIVEFIIGAICWGLPIYYIWKPYETKSTKDYMELAIAIVPFILYTFIGYTCNIHIIKAIHFSTDSYSLNLIGYFLSCVTSVLIYHFLRAFSRKLEKMKNSDK